jgi:hypothetical protein
MPCSSQYWFDHPNCIWWRIQRCIRATCPANLNVDLITRIVFCEGYRDAYVPHALPISMLIWSPELYLVKNRELHTCYTPYPS